MAGEPIQGTDRRRPGLFDPAGGGILGAIGAIQGFPTAARAEELADAAQVSEVRERGLTALANEIQKAQGDFQRGILNFANSETGQEVITKDFDFFKEVQGIFADALAQPEPTAAQRNQAANAALVAEALDVDPQIVQQRMAVADFQKKLNEAKQGKGGFRERMVLRGIENNIISETEGIAVGLGLAEIDDQIDPRTNEPTGNKVLVTPAGTRVISPGSPEERGLVSRLADVSKGATGTQPTQPGAQQDQTGVRPGDEDVLPQSLRNINLPEVTEDRVRAAFRGFQVDNIESLERPGQVLEAAGVGPTLLRTLQGFAGQPFPELAGREEAAKSSAIKRIEDGLGALKRNNVGRVAASEVERIIQQVRGRGIDINPLQVGEKLIGVREELENELIFRARESVAPGISQKQRDEAVSDVQAISRFLSLVPSKEALKEEIAILESGEVSPFRETQETLEQATGVNLPGTPQQGQPATPGLGGAPGQQAAPIGQFIQPQDQPLGQQSPQTQPGLFEQAGQVAGDFFRTDPNAITQPDTSGGIGASQFGEFVLDKFRNIPALPAATRQAVTEIEKAVPSSVAQGILDMGAGFNGILANRLGIGVDALDSALRGLVNRGFLEAPGNGAEELKQALRDQGIVADEKIDSFMNDVGVSLFDAGLLAAATITAGATLAPGAAGSATGFIRQFFKEQLDFISRFPTLALAGEAGAAAGIEFFERELAEAQTENMSPALAAATNAAGGLIFGLLGAVAGTGAMSAATGSLRKRLTEMVSDTPLLQGARRTAEDEIDLTPLRAFAEEAVESDRMRVNNSIRQAADRVVQRVMDSDDPAAVGKAVDDFRRDFRRIDNIASRFANRLWSRAKVGRRMPARNIKNITEGVEKLVTRFAGENPTETTLSDNTAQDVVRDIRGLRREIAQPGGGTREVFRKQTIDDLRKMRSNLLARVRSGEGSRTKRDFLRRTAALINNEIEAAFPNDPDLSKAIAFSRAKAERFEGEAFRSFLSKKKTADTQAMFNRILRESTLDVETLESGRPAMSVVRDISTGLRKPELVQRAEQALREMFTDAVRGANIAARERAASGDPRAPASVTEGAGLRAGAAEGRRFLRRPEVRRALEELPELQADAEIAAESISRNLAEFEEIGRSAFAMFTNRSPTETIDTIMNQPNKTELVEEMVTRLEGNRDALHGLQNGLMNWVFRGRDPESVSVEFFRNRLSQPGVREAFRTAFGDQGMVRLNRMLNAAERQETDGPRLVTRLFESGARLGARVGGAGAGRALNTGTIQTPGIISSAAGNIMNAVFGRFNPSRLLAAGMLDPRFERVLLSRDPTQVAEAKRVGRNLNKLQGVAAELAALKEGSDER